MTLYKGDIFAGAILPTRDRPSLESNDIFLTTSSFRVELRRPAGVSDWKVLFLFLLGLYLFLCSLAARFYPPPPHLLVLLLVITILLLLLPLLLLLLLLLLVLLLPLLLRLLLLLLLLLRRRRPPPPPRRQMPGFCPDPQWRWATHHHHHQQQHHDHQHHHHHHHQTLTDDLQWM